MTNRSIALDIIKGILVINMVIFHTLYVGEMYSIIDVNIYTGFFWLYPRVIAAGFIFVSGMNLEAKKERGSQFKSFAKRSLKLFGIALLISIATYIALGKNFVFFGIFHMLALSGIIVYPLLQKPILQIITGIVCSVAGFFLNNVRFDFTWLCWLGLRPKNVYPSDYEPLFPWFAFICFGAATYYFYSKSKAKQKPKNSKKIKKVKEQKHNIVVRFLTFAGKHSIWIYLIHLPLLYGIGMLISLL